MVFKQFGSTKQTFSKLILLMVKLKENFKIKNNIDKSVNAIQV